jgi:hypothetical protein
LWVGRKADDLALEKFIIAKSKKSKTGCNLAESSNKDYGPQKDVLPMMMKMNYNIIE